MSLANGQYRVPFPVIQKFTDTGFETIGAQTNFNEDYSVTPKNAIFQAAPGFIIPVVAFQFAITDSGTFADDDYGNIVGGLPKGILTEVVLNGITITNPAATVNTNAELFGVDSFAQIVSYSSNDRTLVARFTLAVPAILNGNTNDKIMFVLQDDMSGLRIHEFTAYASI